MFQTTRTPLRKSNDGASTTPTPPRSALKKTTTPSDSSIRSISFREEVTGRLIPTKEEIAKREAKEALLAAAHSTPDSIDNTEKSDSHHSGHSLSSGGSSTGIVPFMEALKEEDGRSILSIDGRLGKMFQQSDNEIQQRIDQNVEKIASELFLNDYFGRLFTINLIKKNFYYANKISLGKDCSLLEETSIPMERENTFNVATERVNNWLKSFSIPDLIKKMRDTVAQYYPQNTFLALLFEKILLQKVISSKRIQNYTNATDLFDIVFSGDDSIDRLHASLSPTLDIFIEISQSFYQINTLSILFFRQYILIFYTSFHISTENISDLRRGISESLNSLHADFLAKTQIIINTLPASIPLWQTWYLLWFHGLELLAQENPSELTIKKFRDLYVASNQNNGENGVQLANQLLEQLPTDLSSCYFKQDPKTKQRMFSTRKDIEHIVSCSQYNPFSYFYPTFYRQAKETLELFSQKKEVSSLNNK